MDTKLRERAADAEARLEKIDDEIAEAILDGRDGDVSSLRAERARLLDDLTDLAAAERVAAERERRAAEDRAAAKRAGALTEAQRLEGRRRKAASRLDAAVADMEAAFLDHERLCLELEETTSSLRRGRLLDLNVRKRIVLAAFWNAAPKLASALSLAFTPGNKRSSMATAFEFDFTEDTKEPF